MQRSSVVVLLVGSMAGCADQAQQADVKSQVGKQPGHARSVPVARQARSAPAATHPQRTELVGTMRRKDYVVHVFLGCPDIADLF